MYVFFTTTHHDFNKPKWRKFHGIHVNLTLSLRLLVTNPTQNTCHSPVFTRTNHYTALTFEIGIIDTSWILYVINKILTIYSFLNNIKQSMRVDRFKVTLLKILVTMLPRYSRGFRGSPADSRVVKTLQLSPRSYSFQFRRKIVTTIAFLLIWKKSETYFSECIDIADKI